MYLLWTVKEREFNQKPIEQSGWSRSGQQVHCCLFLGRNRIEWLLTSWNFRLPGKILEFLTFFLFNLLLISFAGNPVTFFYPRMMFASITEWKCAPFNPLHIYFMISFWGKASILSIIEHTSSGIWNSYFTWNSHFAGKFSFCCFSQEVRHDGVASIENQIKGTPGAQQTVKGVYANSEIKFIFNCYTRVLLVLSFWIASWLSEWENPFVVKEL